MEDAPEDYSQAQLDELDKLTGGGLPTKTSKKGKRTRHS
jgi:hypothetical protein